MAESTLQDRLREHAEAFDGLLSLIPAKYYYGEDTSDQWKKKKQTKQQAAAARRAKLDPESAKTAKDVMDERAKKRKLEESEDIEDGSEVEGIEKELPKQGLKKPVEKPAKKLKTDTESAKETDKAATPKKDATPKKNLTAEEELARLEKRNQKEEQKKAKAAKKAAKQKAKREEAVKQVVELPTEDIPARESTTKDKVASGGVSKQAATTKTPTKKSTEHEVAADEEPEHDHEIGHFEAEGLEEPESTKSSPPSSTFSAPNEDATSGGTSTSSTVAPTGPPKHITLPADPEILRSRLAARIEALRAARKASNSDGTPVRNRQELMEQRRKKEEQRRAHKKELRLQAKIDEEARREAALVSARSNLTALKSIPKKKGPQDVNSALAAAAKKQSRLESMDAEKREDIEEKERWLIAKKRVNGEKVRDDSSLLKKTLKRKEKQKKKSEKEWTERIDGVKRAGAMKQRRERGEFTCKEGRKGWKGKEGWKEWKACWRRKEEE
ncbi:hypothetical protein DID88_001771 [Monilinia fructigena]|uniref:Ribosomal RNA-processing protein 14/surfeit locus protein 6 C-terminal domain-containing protein n=1 Tax=Monilinia fructigena TaxID=38457 RepID=A0A395IWS7_9HELO|nr:hypothetical protein DID88_001771 [Monilinia fructigena]